MSTEFPPYESERICETGERKTNLTNNENVSEIASASAKSLLGFISSCAGIATTWRDPDRKRYENEMLACLQGWTEVWWLAADAEASLQTPANLQIRPQSSRESAERLSPDIFLNIRRSFHAPLELWAQTKHEKGRRWAMSGSNLFKAAMLLTSSTSMIAVQKF